MGALRWPEMAVTVPSIAVLFMIAVACSSEEPATSVSCKPNCDGRNCGEDGCGGVCGECVSETPFCEEGVCSADCVSDAGCTEPGLSSCLDESFLHTCLQVVTGCYQWGEVVACEEGHTCTNGGCSSGEPNCGESLPVANGMIKCDIADMDFTGEEVSIKLHHKLDIDEWEDGCISRYTIDLSKMGLGCDFHLEMTTDTDGELLAVDAALYADSFCPGWSDADEGKYLMMSSSLSLCSNVEVADYMTVSSCIPKVSIQFTGLLEMERVADGSPLTIDLTELVIQGDMTSEGKTELACPEVCSGKACGMAGCGVSCGECADGWMCSDDYQCFDPCFGSECGSDGFGGSCGSCSDGWKCLDDNQCHDPCSGKECGLDGFGGSCGNCECGGVCEAGQCFDKICDGVECGSDGCGGSCGECVEGSACNAGECVCVPICDGKECGADGCVGKCGDCEAGASCLGGACWSIIWADSTSGLVWQNGSSEEMPWAEAVLYCESSSMVGEQDWRLPNVGELRSLIRGCQPTTLKGNCNIAESNCLAWSCRSNSCDGCNLSGGPAGDGCYWPEEISSPCGSYWSSSTVDDIPGSIWDVSFSQGAVGATNAVATRMVRCVRND
jgi:hypothetical protein